MSYAQDKATVSGKIKKIDPVSHVLVIEAWGKEVEFSDVDASLFEKLRKNDIGLGERITVWYVKSDGKNLIRHLRFQGCG